MGFGVLGFWVFGVLGFWGFGVLGFWGFGVLGFWGLGREGVRLLMDVKRVGGGGAFWGYEKGNHQLDGCEFGVPSRLGSQPGMKKLSWSDKKSGGLLGDPARFISRPTPGW